MHIKQTLCMLVKQILCMAVKRPLCMPESLHAYQTDSLRGRLLNRARRVKSPVQTRRPCVLYNIKLQVQIIRVMACLLRLPTGMSATGRTIAYNPHKLAVTAVWRSGGRSATTLPARATHVCSSSTNARLESTVPPVVADPHYPCPSSLWTDM